VVSANLLELVPKFQNSIQNQILTSDEAILIKGARDFKFEEIGDALQQKTHRTVLEISLEAIQNNLNYFRSLLQPKTKIMAMVKAFSYGSGSFEIANFLEHQRVDYLGVAFADEGVALRKAGIKLPIIVMNPEEGSYENIITYGLEPEIYSFRSIELFNNLLEQLNQHDYPIHLKIDTGMKRLGFLKYLCFVVLCFFLMKPHIIQFPSEPFRIALV